MGKKNSTLTKAQINKDIEKDEYYTLYEDIADELPNYKDQLKGKKIICPCDWDESYDEALVYKEAEFIAPLNLLSEGGTVKEIELDKSKELIERNLDSVKCNFVKFLVAHAESYGIKSVAVSGYNPANGRGVRFQDIDYNKYDVVITNPPFSQIIEFFDILMEYPHLKFLIIGPLTAIGYKNAFQYLRDNKMWLGYHYHLKGFVRPDGTIIPKTDSTPRSSVWYTNLTVSYRNDWLILTEKYDPDKYPRYYNYKQAIDVSRTNLIPYDYDGEMGVPISFLQKHNPDQFELVISNRLIQKSPRWSGDKSNLWIEKDGKPYKCPFERIIIKNKRVVKDEDQRIIRKSK